MSAAELGEFDVRRASESEADTLIGIDAIAVEGNGPVYSTTQ
ncbi:hypothetical protein ACH4KO_19155 [Streptomyces anulatus]